LPSLRAPVQALLATTVPPAGRTATCAPVSTTPRRIVLGGIAIAQDGLRARACGVPN
jgi:hypothetical protein